MRNRKRYPVALIGCGDVALRGHLPALLSHERFEIAAVCDIVPDRAALLAARARGVASYTNYRELFRLRNLAACVLALHPDVSVAVAIDCLRHGLAVLDEKPLANSRTEGRRLARAVYATRGIYQVGYCFRYCDWVKAIGELARSVGAPAIYRVEIFDEVLNRSDPEHFERIQQFLETSSVVNHEGSHVIDYFQMWNPSPFVKAHAVTLRTEPDLRGPNLWSVQLECADGSLLELQLGWLLRVARESQAAIVGPGGVVCAHLSGAAEIARHGKTEVLRIPCCRQEFGRQLDAFAAAIDRGEAVVATVDDGLRAMAVAHACERSAAEGKAIEIQRLTPHVGPVGH